MTTTHRPPRLARWLFKLFIADETVSPILGDLEEEFATISAMAGASLARRWYWRQVATTAPRLVWAQLTSAPWQTVAGVLGGVLLLWLANIPLMAIRDYYPERWPGLIRFGWMLGYPLAVFVAPPVLSGFAITVIMRKSGPVPSLVLSVAASAFRFALIWLIPQHVSAPPPFWSALWLNFASTWYLRAPLTHMAVAVWPVLVLSGGLLARQMNSRVRVAQAS